MKVPLQMDTEPSRVMAPPNTIRAWLTLLAATAFIVSVVGLFFRPPVSPVAAEPRASAPALGGRHGLGPYPDREPMAESTDADLELESPGTTQVNDPITLSSCLEADDPQLRTACVEEFLSSAGDLAGYAVGEQLCADMARGGDGRNAPAVIAACMRSWVNSEILGELDKIQTSCPSFQTGDFIKMAMLQILETDPQLLQAIRDEITAESVFREGRTELAVILAAEVGIALGDVQIRDLLISGATGELGGTATQMDLSALCVIRMIEDPEGVLDLVQSVTDSPSLPMDVGPQGMGSSLMLLLSMPGIQESLPEQKWVDAVMSVLDHPVLGWTAAVHILEKLQQPLKAVSTETWANVRAHAEVIKSLGPGW